MDSLIFWPLTIVAFVLPFALIVVNGRKTVKKGLTTKFIDPWIHSPTFGVVWAIILLITPFFAMGITNLLVEGVRSSTTVPGIISILGYTLSILLTIKVCRIDAKELHDTYNELIINPDFGKQTEKSSSVFEKPWFKEMKEAFDSGDYDTALLIITKEKEQNIKDSALWHWEGTILSQLHNDPQKEVESCMRGALICNSGKVGLLQKAAEVLLLEMQDVYRALSFHIHAIMAITPESKEYGNSNAAGFISQERAFQFFKTYLITYGDNPAFAIGFNPNKSFKTELDSAYIQKINTALNSALFKQDYVTNMIFGKVKQVTPEVFKHWDTLEQRN